MRKMMMGMALVGLLACQAARAADAPDKVNQTLQKYYGANANVKISKNYQMGGVKVYEAAVTTKAGQGTAAVTEVGDLLYAGTPVADSDLPAPVKDVAENLFQSPATQIELVDRVYYYINVNAGKGTYELKFDASGRLVNIRSYAQTQLLQKGASENDQALRHNLAAAAQADYPGTTANDVHTYGNAPGYYVVSVSKNKEPGWVVMDKNGGIFSSRIPILLTEQPNAVYVQIQHLLKSEYTKSALKGIERVYEVHQVNNIVFRVHPNGDVISVGAHEENQ